jgi:hypothetical protein
VLDNIIGVLGRLTTVDDLVVEWADDDRHCAVPSAWAARRASISEPMFASR